MQNNRQELREEMVLEHELLTKRVRQLVLNHAKTQNSFIRKDGSNAFNEMVDDIVLAMMDYRGQREREVREEERKNAYKELDKFVGLVLYKLGGEITFTQMELDTHNLDYQKKANHDGSITFKALNSQENHKHYFSDNGFGYRTCECGEQEAQK